MKQKLLFLFIAFMYIAVNAQTFTVGGINYEVTAANEVKVIATSVSGDVIIPESVNNSGTDYAVTSIDNNAFENQFGIDSVTIPNSVISIGNYAFNDCFGMTSITFGNSLNSIGEFAFQSCILLNSISLPNSLQTISDKAFQYCTGLLTLTIPDSVATIGDSAFYGCSGLTSISIGSLASSIDQYAFGLAGADATLTEVRCAVSTPPTINANVFSNRTIASSSLIVSSGSLSAYQAAAVWNSFGTISGTLSNDSFFLTNNFNFYPNPATNNLTVKTLNLTNPKLEVVSTLGKVLLVNKPNNSSINIDLDNLPQGIYLLILTCDEGVISKKFIKK